MIITISIYQTRQEFAQIHFEKIVEQTIATIVIIHFRILIHFRIYSN